MSFFFFCTNLKIECSDKSDILTRNNNFAMYFISIETFHQ